MNNSTITTIDDKKMIDLKSDSLRDCILNAKSDFQIAKNKWYISSSGNNNNDGSSPSSAWATTEALEIHKDKIQFGDAVLFECGSLFRGNIIARSGIYYGSYGDGPKPCLCMSRANYAQKEWTKVEEHLWEIELFEYLDAGSFIANHGECYGDKLRPIDEFSKDLDFTFYPDRKVLRVFSQEDPSKRFKDIEIGDLVHIFWLCGDLNNVTIDNLALKYTGGMGIGAMGNQIKNVIIKNCEIAWCGGSYMPNYGDGCVRFGNGIEFYGGCENVLIQNNWIYQIYDSAFTNQGNGNYVVKNLKFANNLVEYTSFGSIEYWVSTPDKVEYYDVAYVDNILRYGGCGWGESGQGRCGANIVGAFNGNVISYNFRIENNIIEKARTCLIRLIHPANNFPIMSGNMYCQTKGGTLLQVGEKNDVEPICMSEYAKEKIEQVLKDFSASVSYC